MALEVEELEQIGGYVKAHLGEWMVEAQLGKPLAVYEVELRERMVRVEEELKHQRELMQEGFAVMARRFEQADRRFEELREDMNARFEQVDRRFEQVDRRFEEMNQRIDRFMRWSFGLTVASAGTVIAVLKLWV